MVLYVKYEKQKPQLFRLKVTAHFIDGLAFTFKSIYLHQGPQLIINTPFIKKQQEKRIAYIFSKKLKDFIAYHVIAAKKDIGELTLIYKNDPKCRVKKVNDIHYRYGRTEVDSMYNILFGNDIRIKHICLMIINNKTSISFPKNRHYKDLCNPSESNTRSFVDTEILQICSQ